MKRSFLRPVPAVVLACSLLFGACAAPQPIPIGQVMQSARSGESAQRVIETLRSSKTTYALRGSDFGKLRNAGVPDAVLDHVQQQFFDDVDLLTRYWVLGDSVGGCVRCVPLEVDLSDPAAPRMTSTSTSPSVAHPQGMPSWYRPYSPRREEVSLPQIREMARSGISEQALLEQLRNRRLDHVVGVGGIGTVRTRPLAGISGSELAQLYSDGVPDAVIDEVQTIFLGQFVETERLRYQNLGKGPGKSPQGFGKH
ncbi:MAG: hypothetical protein KIS79_01775 [Burkholderiales bacterium]|nr:hypothetical protein [Burkholderiales bacterium]